MESQFYFTDKELAEFMEKIGSESELMINKIIKKYSPIQVGEDVETGNCVGEKKVLRVSKITLNAINSWGYPGEKLSFEYEGLPLSKNGEPMKNRTPIGFNLFFKDGKRYYMPSYNRFYFMRARMTT